MNKENKYSSFYDEYIDEFNEYLDDIRTYLQYNNKEYIKLSNEMNKLIDTSENIICNDYINKPLSVDESKRFAKIISIYIDMQSIIEREIYFKGGAEAYDYFKKIGIIV